MTESDKKKQTRKTGDIGEQIAQNYLKSHGYNVIETNYLKKWGELDIIARKTEVIHFIEVKTASYESKRQLEGSLTSDSWRPEEMVHDFKLHQIEKALESWLVENSWAGEWQIGVIAVRMVPSERYATVEHLENVVK